MDIEHNRLVIPASLAYILFPKDSELYNDLYMRVGATTPVTITRSKERTYRLTVRFNDKVYKVDGDGDGNPQIYKQIIRKPTWEKVF